MSKESVYYPNYQMRPKSYERRRDEYSFWYKGAHLVAKTPFFGATETQKAAMDWASYSTPPVICIRHQKPVKPDRNGFCDPNDLHRHYRPYAMVIATIECLGEAEPRRVKIYFCETSLHEHNDMQSIDKSWKDQFIQPLDELSRSEATSNLLRDE